MISGGTASSSWVSVAFLLSLFGWYCFSFFLNGGAAAPPLFGRGGGAVFSSCGWCFFFVGGAPFVLFGGGAFPSIFWREEEHKKAVRHT